MDKEKPADPWMQCEKDGCNKKTDGIGTRLCYRHHKEHFEAVQRHDPNGCIAGRPGYLGHHGHLNR